MFQIKGKNIKPEMLVRRYLHSHGYRYKLHDKTLPGKPDIVLPKYKTVIFIQGCFWHGHTDCEYYVLSKAEGLVDKITSNKSNDNNAKVALNTDNWKVIYIWECELKNNKVSKTLNSLLKKL